MREQSKVAVDLVVVVLLQNLLYRRLFICYLIARFFHASLILMVQYYRQNNIFHNKTKDQIYKLRNELISVLKPTQIDNYSSQHVRVKQIVLLCGKCHKFALITIDRRSNDTLFSYELFSVLRWETWLLWVVLLSLWYYRMGWEPLDVALLFVLTVNIIRNPSIIRKNTYKSVNRFYSYKVELQNVVLFCIITYISLLFNIKPITQYILLYLLSFLITLIMVFTCLTINKK